MNIKCFIYNLAHGNNYSSKKADNINAICYFY